MSSAKWRAMQHRHRYTYSTVTFPPSFTDDLSSSPLLADPKSAPFYAHLTRLPSLTSTYSQVAHSKTLANSFSALLASLKPRDPGDRSLVEAASRFYLEVLFLENSLPLHRTLVSGFSKVSDEGLREAICGCFGRLCEEYGEREKRRRFCLSRVALSVLGMPKLGYLVSVVEGCAGSVAWDVVLGLQGVVLETEELARPSPIVMEQCQEGLSCLYYLVQRFPERFKGEGTDVMERVLGVLIRVLKSGAFSRDCFVAAGVSFCAALQVCLGAEELGLFIMEGIFGQSSCIGADGGCSIQLHDIVSKVPFRGDLCIEIRSFSVLSRLCLIRGILTAVSREVLNAHFVVSGGYLNGQVENGNHCCSLVKTILYDGVLPKLCFYCENPVDSHFNFHALTVMQICLQQMKTSMLGKSTKLSENYHPVSEEMGTRLLKIIWNNLEDPLSQTVKQVHLIFDLFLDIQSSIHWGDDNSKIKIFLQKIASDLLRLGSRCKGRYVPLAMLAKRLGAKTLLDMSPNLVSDTIQAYIDDDVCCAATNFLRCFLEHLRDECWDSNGIEGGYAILRGHCLPAILLGLASGVSKLRSNLNTYALPVLLEVDVDCIFPMLDFVLVGPNQEDNKYQKPLSFNIEIGVEQKVAILVSFLKVCRSLALIEGDIDSEETSVISETSCPPGTESMNCFAIVCIKGIKVKVLIEWLVMALTHNDEFLRVDTAESLFLNPKTSSIPSGLELRLLREAIPLNMRSSSTSFQMKWSSLFRKFFSRVRTALERQFKQGSWQPDNHGPVSNLGIVDSGARGAEDLFNFMRWLSSFLFFSCYPSAPYRRKIMAMELMLIMLNVWSIIPHLVNDSVTSSDSYLHPYNDGLTSPNSTSLLVGSIIDSWDRLRENSFRILLHFPTPLPGVSSEEKVSEMITWAKKLVCSPRVRESDAGALAMRLIFRKYVLELGWFVRVSVDVSCSRLQTKLVLANDLRPPVMEYIKSLVDWLNAAVEDGERDLLEACKNSFVHGVLLTLRYTFEELDWNSDAVVSCILGMKQALEKLLELVMRITSLALGVVSADAWHLPNADETLGDDNFLVDDMDVQTISDFDGDSSTDLHDKRPQEQIVMVGCWLAMKEVSLLLGTIIRKVPLPINDCSVLSQIEDSSSDGSVLTTSVEVLDIEQLEQIGSHFLEVLLKMKHNGAIDKTRAGFTALCNRLLCSNDPRLCRLTESWMEQLMERTVSKGQVVDDLLRRSAGIPAAFIALFLSEPEGAPKKLLPYALRWLIDVASSLLHDPVNSSSSNITSSNLLSVKSDQETFSPQPYEKSALERSSKVRDEGVIPTVHAFNILRASFNDTNLATDTSGFAAEAMILSVRSFSSPYWEVRNSACLTYTALVRRMVGFLNVQKRESARRALTGLEFFHRYPSLHPFVYNELQIATDLLNDASVGHLELNLVNAVHPSLCPVLILLSRLKPSTIASESGDDLDPFLFMPFIRKCSMQSNLRIRVIASRALSGLVSNEKLPLVLLNIASELPCLEDAASGSSANGTSHVETQSTKGNNGVSFNSVHGMLLQLSTLVDSNCRNLADSVKREKIVGDIFQVVAKHSWIASPKSCPCPILNALYLRVLDHMLSVARTGLAGETFYSIRNLLLDLSTECLDIEDSYGLPYYDPTIAEVREQAAISYFSCVQHLPKENLEEVIPKKLTQMSSYPTFTSLPDVTNTFPGLQERLVRSLSDSSYEVRLATLKWLLRFVKFLGYPNDVLVRPSHELGDVVLWTNSYLHSKMMELLYNEKHHRCNCYILKILFTWNSLHSHRFEGAQSSDTNYIGNLDFESLCKFWDKLVSMYKVMRHIKTRETLICCMATCVNCFAGLLTTNVLSKLEESSANLLEMQRAARIYEYLTFFVDRIKEHSSSSEPVNMRRASVESIVASGLLEQAEPIGSSMLGNLPQMSPSCCFTSEKAANVYGGMVLEMWFICIKLLEDEDDGIRERLALNLQSCLTSIGSAGCSNAEGSSTQVEKVIQLCFGHLSSIFGNWVHYFDHLCQWVFDAANYVTSTGDLVRRVFDKEIDNHHEEKLYICQLCCSNLENLPSLNNWLASTSGAQNFKQYLCEWRMKFGTQLMDFVKDYLQRTGGAVWVGGIGNHRDAFLPVYANLLGFYALSSTILSGDVEDGTYPLVDVVELGKTISPFLSNSLICNLYLLVVRLHRDKLGTSTDSLMFRLEDECIWENFNPYFLLR